jgi:hypothetical protein
MTKALAVGVMLLSLVSLPSLIEGRSWAKPLELARVVTLPGLAALLIVG